MHTELDQAQAATATTPGTYHVLMTPYEFQRFSNRLLIYEQWGLPLDVRVDERERTTRSLLRSPEVEARQSRP